jgi:hypothetical protein
MSSLESPKAFREGIATRVSLLRDPYYLTPNFCWAFFFVLDIYRTTRLCQARTILCTGLLDTKYDAAREDEAISILEEHPELALAKWTGPDDNGQPFILGSTALHYAANDGKLWLMQSLIDLEELTSTHTKLDGTRYRSRGLSTMLILPRSTCCWTMAHRSIAPTPCMLPPLSARISNCGGRRSPPAVRDLNCERMVAGCGTEAPTQDRQRGNGAKAMILMGGSNGVG